MSDIFYTNSASFQTFEVIDTATINNISVNGTLSVSRSIEGTSSYASTALSSSYVSVVKTNAGGTYYPLFVDSNNSSPLYEQLYNSADFLTYNPSEGILTSKTFANVGSGQINNITSSYAITASYAMNGGGTTINTGSFLTTGSSGTSQTISGSLVINQNLTVLGSASITNISQSTLNIGTNLITVNTNTPGIRFGGLAVIDSGSSPQRSGSILFDSTNDQWIFVHQNTGGAITSSVFVQTPQTFNNVGNETNLTTNRVPKSTNAEHIGDSNITDTGTVIQLGSNTQVTGSLIVTGSMIIGSSSLGASENTLTLGARDNGSEGGQLGFNAPGGTYTSSSFIDLYQNRLRILKGTNDTSTGEVARWSMHNLQMGLPGYTSATAFSGTSAATLGVNSNGDVITTMPFTSSYLINGQTTTAGADTTINNLTFITNANEAWAFEATFVGQCSGTGGVRFTVVYSAVPVSSSVSYWGNSTQVGNMTSATTILTTPAQSGTMWATATPIDVQANIRTSFVNGANANTVTIKIQPQNGAQTATLRAMSYITARRIS